MKPYRKQTDGTLKNTTGLWGSELPCSDMMMEMAEMIKITEGGSPSVLRQGSYP